MENSIRMIWRIIAWFLWVSWIVILIFSGIAVVIKNHIDTNGSYAGLQESIINRLTILWLPCIWMICIGYALLSKMLGRRIVILLLGLIIGLLYTWVFGWVWIQQALQ